mmetsp:Transcript_13976/g.52184  ORF Transcript_13976/g.52184 Transcript_13976/m.52184 type:complete len:200 (+) Transcript_13976:1904-2503(+)
MVPSTWADTIPFPSGLQEMAVVKLPVSYTSEALFERSVPRMTAPLASPKNSSPCLVDGHARQVTLLFAPNLLQMLLRSPQSAPSLYTKTMLSLCAIASFVLSGLNAIAFTRYVFGPFSAGFVANLSRFSPLSSNSVTTRSTVHTARRMLFGDHATAMILPSAPVGSTTVFRCVRCIVQICRSLRLWTSFSCTAGFLKLL